MDTPLPEPEQTGTQTPNERLWTANDLARYIGWGRADSLIS